MSARVLRDPAGISTIGAGEKNHEEVRLDRRIVATLVFSKDFHNPALEVGTPLGRCLRARARRAL